MAKAGRFWTEGESQYSTNDCNDVSDAVVASINQYLQTMRVDDYKYLAEQNGLDYFRNALGSGKVIMDVKGITSYLHNVKDKDEIKARVHEVVENMRQVSIDFSDKYKRDHKSQNAIENK